MSAPHLHCLIYIALLLSPCAAGASAWLPHENELKITLSRFDGETALHVPDSPQKLTIDDHYRGILLEYGLSRKLAVTGKLAASRFQLHPHVIKRDLAMFGIMGDAPSLATGLLPPYLFKLLDNLLPNWHLHREKQASLHIGYEHRRSDASSDASSGASVDGYFIGFAMADKISSKRWYLMQQLESIETRLPQATEQQTQYDAALGYGSWQIGSRAEQFRDTAGHYISLSLSVRLRYKPKGAAWEVTLGRGKRRIGRAAFPQGLLERGRIWSVEIQRRF